MFTRVEDVDDPRLVDFTGLTDVRSRTRFEADAGVFVAEGLLTLEAVIGSGRRVRAMLVAENKVERVAAAIGTDPPFPVLVGTVDLLSRIAGFRVHRGVLASVERWSLPDLGSVLAGASTVLVVESVNDHENIGGLFRNAAAFGVDAVVLDRASADPLYRRSVRVSLGHVLRVPWTRSESTVATLSALADHGIRSLALTPSGGITVHRAVAEGRTGIAWVVGAEGAGLSAATLAAVDDTVRIPMAPGVDSLNVATAAAVALAFSRAPG